MELNKIRMNMFAQKPAGAAPAFKGSAVEGLQKPQQAQPQAQLQAPQVPTSNLLSPQVSGAHSPVGNRLNIHA